MMRVKKTPAGTRTRTALVSSAIIGAVDPQGQTRYCPLTAWTGAETERFRELWPLFQAIADHFKRHVPDRYAAQMERTRDTRPEWVIAGTPFTTVTVNNTYPTGVHKDAGDLHEGFSTIGCLRRGAYTGGRLCFPEYRVAVDLQDGDLILMDAHEWHGNTAITKESDDAERISVVCYYRTNMQHCGSADEEYQRALQVADRRNAAHRERAGVGVVRV
jgi:hypothetical protein